MAVNIEGSVSGKEIVEAFTGVRVGIVGANHVVESVVMMQEKKLTKHLLEVVVALIQTSLILKPIQFCQACHEEQCTIRYCKEGV